MNKARALGLVAVVAVSATPLLFVPGSVLRQADPAPAVQAERRDETATTASVAPAPVAGEPQAQAAPEAAAEVQTGAAAEVQVAALGPAASDATAAIEQVAPRRAPDPVLRLDAPEVSAYAAAPDPANPAATIDPAQKLGLDLAGLREGLEAYAANDLVRGDAAAATARDPLVATALEWIALRAMPKEAGYKRIARFVAAHPEWPTIDQLRKAGEEALFAANPAPAAVFSYFAGAAPATAAGRLALARAAEASGQTARFQSLARAVWREDNVSGWLESHILKKFGAVLRPEDHRARAVRLLYKEQVSAGLRAAALAGKDVQALAHIRVAAINEAGNEKGFAKAPAAIVNDPAFIFSKIQFLRRANRLAEAADLMLKAPRDPAAIVDGDEWWIERRLLARKLLDAGEAATAYRIVSGHAAAANDMQVDAEFHSGWIALRFVREPATAIRHFDAAIALARTPISRARAWYWRGRATEAAGEDPRAFYERAALESSAFYGQVARLRLGTADVPMRHARVAAEGAARAESVRVVELLYAAGAKPFATSLAYSAAKSIEAPEQMAALARVVVQDRDAKSALTLGKLASQRGFAMDDLAFPTYGVPRFTPHVNSAPIEIVYSIARQESAFDPKAVSHAGAMGLMQMIASTARRTAQRVGVDFQPGRMTSDPIFNAQLGAAHLGDLLVEQRNSLILTFAAYNAGGKRVKEWIAAHGDPRKPGVDPIDWIELIPIYETRNYVQRVFENLTVYRARLAADPAGKAAAEPLKQEARL